MSVKLPLDVQRFGNSSKRDIVNTYTSASRALSGTPTLLSSISSRAGSAVPLTVTRYRPLAFVRSSTADRMIGRVEDTGGTSACRRRRPPSSGSAFAFSCDGSVRE